MFNDISVKRPSPAHKAKGGEEELERSRNKGFARNDIAHPDVPDNNRKR